MSIFQIIGITWAFLAAAFIIGCVISACRAEYTTGVYTPPGTTSLEASMRNLVDRYMRDKIDVFEFIEKIDDIGRKNIDIPQTRNRKCSICGSYMRSPRIDLCDTCVYKEYTEYDRYIKYTGDKEPIGIYLVDD